MVIIKSVTVWKEHGQIEGIDVRYVIGAKNRFFHKNETLPMDVTMFILDGSHKCITRDLGFGSTEDIYM